ncbi:MAG: hypothetical protein LBS37_05615 [Treponema sp.]|nr:hypothetical protein [Treponema sp.]
MAAASSSGAPGSAKLNGKTETGQTEQMKKKRKKERSAQAACCARGFFCFFSGKTRKNPQLKGCLPPKQPGSLRGKKPPEGDFGRL